MRTRPGKTTASTTWVLGVLDRIDTWFPRIGVIVEPVRAIAARYEADELPTHDGALTYGAFLSLPPLLLLAASVIGFAIEDAAKHRCGRSLTRRFPCQRPS